MNRPIGIMMIGSAMVFQILSSVPAHAADKIRVYFGTYSSELSKGIYVSSLDRSTGKLEPAVLAAEVKNASFVAIHPSRKFLYAVSEISDYQGKPTGGVSGFSIDAASGKLTPLNQQPSMGAGPCHVTVDPSGKNALVANYGGGSIAVIPIDPNGQLKVPSMSIQHMGSSVDTKRQSAPHAHSINLDRSNRFAFAADLGLDRVLIYKFDSEQGKLEPNNPAAGVVPPGGGPRHFAFHPSGHFAFVNNELTSTVTSFGYDSASGGLTEIQTISTLPEATPGNSTAETVVHPNGRFVYVSNRGHNSIAIFQCDSSTGRLTARGHVSSGGKTPRNFNIDPSGQYLLAANQDTNNVAVFKIDTTTGQPTPTGDSIEVGRPVCVKFFEVTQ